jgi:hypothetical protein
MCLHYYFSPLADSSLVLFPCRLFLLSLFKCLVFSLQAPFHCAHANNTLQHLVFQLEDYTSRHAAAPYVRTGPGHYPYTSLLHATRADLSSSPLKACLGGLQAAPDSIKQLHSIFFVPNTPAPKTPDPPNSWI